MITLRRSNERGHVKEGWLESYHSFSFADYYDPSHVHFGPLRVVNEDWIAPSRGFGMHPHRDMEIITYVLEGELAHRDSMGNGGTIKAGDVQFMSAGTGIMHSETNASNNVTTHLYQIWIIPNRKSVKPRYGQTHLEREPRMNSLFPIASPEGTQGSIPIYQDASLYNAIVESSKSISHSLAEGRKAYAQIVRGTLNVNGEQLTQGDAAMISEERSLQIANSGEQEAEVLLFDLG